MPCSFLNRDSFVLAALASLDAVQANDLAVEAVLALPVVASKKVSQPVSGGRIEAFDIAGGVSHRESLARKVNSV